MQEKNTFLHIFSLRLKAAMKRKELNQSKLAALVGVRQTTISDYVNAKAVPAADILFRIAQITGKPMEWFCGGQRERELYNGVMTYNAEKIRAWLKANKRSQAWLAGKVGVHTGTVNRWLQGHLQPTASKIILLERIMKGADSFELPQESVRLKLPAEVWGLVEALAAAQGVSAEEYVHRCAAQLAEELASLLINANKNED